MKKIGYLSLSVLFALQAFTLSLSLPELVLCVAEDHVRLELQTMPESCQHGNDLQTTLFSLKHAFHTDDCVDVSLFLHNNNVLNKQHVFYTHLSSGFLPFVFDEQRPAICRVASRVPILPYQRNLRSVVLLI